MKAFKWPHCIKFTERETRNAKDGGKLQKTNRLDYDYFSGIFVINCFVTD